MIRGSGWREPWLQQLAADSAQFRWTIEEVVAAVADDMEWASARGLKLTSLTTLAEDGRLAAHPDVRDEYRRLSAIKDEVWAQQEGLAVWTVRRRYHTIVDLMRLEREPNTRHHSASSPAYIRHLQDELADKLAPLDQNCAFEPEPAGAEQLETSWATLTYEADLQTIAALVRKSSSSGIPIQQLIDEAVRNFLK